MTKPIHLISMIVALFAIIPIIGISNSIDQNLPVTIEGDSEICEGTSTTLTATPGYVTYSWNTGDFADSSLLMALMKFVQA